MLVIASTKFYYLYISDIYVILSILTFFCYRFRGRHSLGSLIVDAINNAGVMFYFHVMPSHGRRTAYAKCIFAKSSAGINRYKIVNYDLPPTKSWASNIRKCAGEFLENYVFVWKNACASGQLCTAAAAARGSSEKERVCTALGGAS